MIGRLSFLQKLFEFNVSDKKKKKQQPRNASSVIEELEGLNHLTGDLNINYLENVSSGTDACKANLKEKKNLGSLRLTWGGGEGDHHHAVKNNHEAVLEGLEPHPNLRTLCIDGFKGSKLPRWIEKDSSCLPNLEMLALTRDIYIEQLAGFGTLPSLRSLTLEFMQSLKEWNIVPVQASTTTITGDTTTHRFPLLEELFICHCPLLTTITPTIFPSLKDLFLQDIDGRAAKTLVTNNLNYSLTSLTLDHISKLISLPSQGLMENNNTLLSLTISECPEFKGFLPPNKDEDDDDQGGEGQEMNISQVVSSSSSCSSSLQYLVLNDCPALRFYPNISSLTSLRGLEIKDCKESKSLLTCLPSSFSSLEHLQYAILNIIKTGKEEEVVGSSTGRVCGGKGTTTASSTSWKRTWILGRMF